MRVLCARFIAHAFVGLLLVTLCGSSVLSRSPIDESDELLGLSPGRRGGKGSVSPQRPQRSDNRQPALAYVDVPLVTLLHPLMARYHVEAKSFMRPLPEGKSHLWPRLTEQRRLKARALREQVRKEAEQIRKQLMTIGKEKALVRNELNREVLRLRNELSQHLLGDRANAETHHRRHSKAYASVHEDYWKKVRAFEAREEKLTRRKSALDEKVAATNFLDRKERSKLLFRIEREVLAAIKGVVNARGYTMVFNSGYLHEATKEQVTVRHSGAQTGGRGYYSTPYLEFLFHSPEPMGRHGTVMASGLVNSWVQQKSRILPDTYGHSQLNSFILTGGDDISAKVLDALFVKYKVSKAKRQFLIRKFFRQ